MKQPIKMTPGDELHLTALMAPFSLNLVTGQDRQHLLGYGRAAFEAGQAGQCLHQIQEPEADIWPCVNIDVDASGKITNAKLYSPGLPAGNHDVYPVRVPYMDEHTEAWRACVDELEKAVPGFMSLGNMNGIECAVAAIRGLSERAKHQEPAAAEQAAWHAGLNEGRAQAVPAAVAWTMPAEPTEQMIEVLMAGEDRLRARNGDDLPKQRAKDRYRALLSLAATPAAAPMAKGYDSGIQTGNRVTLIFETQDAATAWFESFSDAYDAENGTHSIALPIPISPTAAAAASTADELAKLQALSVTNILLDVVPGFDGMGHEVYATSVDEVVEKLSDLGRRLEDYQLGITAAAPVVLPEPWGYLVEGRIFIGRLLPQHVNSMVESEGVQPTKLFTEPQLRALLATATGLPAQAGHDRHGVAPNIDKWKLVDGDMREACDGLLTYHADAYREGLADAAQAQADARDAEITWPKARDVGRIGDMSQVAHIRVGFDSDNDVLVSVWDEKGGGSIEFCNPGGGGGGQSSRTRTALIALMVAMEADNAEKPSRDWWAQRAAIAAAKGE